MKEYPTYTNKEKNKPFYTSPYFYIPAGLGGLAGLGALASLAFKSPAKAAKNAVKTSDVKNPVKKAVVEDAVTDVIESPVEKVIKPPVEDVVESVVKNREIEDFLVESPPSVSPPQRREIEDFLVESPPSVSPPQRREIEDFWLEPLNIFPTPKKGTKKRIKWNFGPPALPYTIPPEKDPNMKYLRGTLSLQDGKDASLDLYKILARNADNRNLKVSFSNKPFEFTSRDYISSLTAGANTHSLAKSMQETGDSILDPLLIYEAWASSNNARKLSNIPSILLDSSSNLAKSTRSRLQEFINSNNINTPSRLIERSYIIPSMSYTNPILFDYEDLLNIAKTSNIPNISNKKFHLNHVARELIKRSGMSENRAMNSGFTLIPTTPTIGFADYQGWKNKRLSRIYSVLQGDTPFYVDKTKKVLSGLLQVKSSSLDIDEELYKQLKKLGLFRNTNYDQLVKQNNYDPFAVQKYLARAASELYDSSDLDDEMKKRLLDALITYEVPLKYLPKSYKRKFSNEMKYLSEVARYSDYAKNKQDGHIPLLSGNREEFYKDPQFLEWLSNMRSKGKEARDTLYSRLFDRYTYFSSVPTNSNTLKKKKLKNKLLTY